MNIQQAIAELNDSLSQMESFEVKPFKDMNQFEVDAMKTEINRATRATRFVISFTESPESKQLLQIHLNIFLNTLKEL